MPERGDYLFVGWTLTTRPFDVCVVHISCLLWSNIRHVFQRLDAQTAQPQSASALR